MYIRLNPQGLAVPVLTALVYANKVKKKEKSRVPFSVLFKPSTQTSTSPSLVERVSLSLSLRKVRSTLSFSLSHLQFFLYLCCYFSIWFNVNHFLQAVCNLINCLFSYIFIKTLWTLPKQAINLFKHLPLNFFPLDPEPLLLSFTVKLLESIVYPYISPLTSYLFLTGVIIGPLFLPSSSQNLHSIFFQYTWTQTTMEELNKLMEKLNWINLAAFGFLNRQKFCCLSASPAFVGYSPLQGSCLIIKTCRCFASSINLSLDY